MKIHIVTHTKPRANVDPTISFNSVNAAINGLQNVEFHVIKNSCTTRQEYRDLRYDSLKLCAPGDFITFVDDDDTVSLNSIRLCQLAVTQNPNIGLVFTKHHIVEGNHRRIVEANAVTYEMAMSHPVNVHHLVLMNAQYITDRSYNISNKYDFGEEWAMRVEVMQKAEARLIPIIGYNWNQHELQHSKQSRKDRDDPDTAAVIRKMSQEFSTWEKKFGGVIPEWS